MRCWFAAYTAVRCEKIQSYPGYVRYYLPYLSVVRPALLICGTSSKMEAEVVCIRIKTKVDENRRQSYY